MLRIPEPELMLSSEQVSAYAGADFSATDVTVLLKLKEFLSSIGKAIDEKTLIVDLGCGPGNIAEMVSKEWPYANVLGIDGSAEMLQMAMKRKKLQPQLKKLSYVCSNISLLALGSSSVDICADIVLSNSLMHHIHSPIIFWQAIKNISNSGSVQFHRDLRRPDHQKSAISLVEKYASESPSLLKHDYLASLQASFTVEEIKLQLKQTDLNKLKVVDYMDRYLEVVGVFN